MANHALTKVSVIIPAFNQARFLAQAVESVLRQTHREIEVVVIDDGSTDTTPEVAQSFGDRIKYVRQDNAGLPAARNRGLQESTGEYVSFLDSDDFFQPDKIERQARLLDADAALGFVYCDVVMVDEAGQALADGYSVTASGRRLSGDIFPSLMLGGYFPPHTVLIRRRVLESVGNFDPELGGHADYDLWLRVAGAGHRAGYVDEKLASYRNHGDSMSKDGQHMADTRAATLRKIARLHPELVGQAAHELQRVHQELFSANQWLNANWKRALQETSITATGRDTNARQQFQFLKLLPQARLVRGQPEQMAVWDVTLNDERSQAIWLHPPAEALFEIPCAEAGQLRTAVALHPDVWANPKSGGCEFHIRIDGRLAFVIALDPVNLAADQCWYELTLEVPATSHARHSISLETRAVGGSAEFRWALWRAPRFVVKNAGAPVATAARPAAEPVPTSF